MELYNITARSNAVQTTIKGNQDPQQIQPSQCVIPLRPSQSWRNQLTQN